LQQEEEARRARLACQKMRNYAKFVREMHPPKLRSQTMAQSEQSEPVKTPLRSRKSVNLSMQGSSEDGPRKKMTWEIKKSLETQHLFDQKDLNRIQYKDYLKEIKTTQPSSEVVNSPAEGIDRRSFEVLKSKDLSEGEKGSLMRFKASQLDEKWKMKEALIRSKARVVGKRMEGQIEANEFLMHSIKAKLSMLEHLS